MTTSNQTNWTSVIALCRQWTDESSLLLGMLGDLARADAPFQMVHLGTEKADEVYATSLKLMAWLDRHTEMDSMPLWEYACAISAFPGSTLTDGDPIQKVDQLWTSALGVVQRIYHRAAPEGEAPTRVDVVRQRFRPPACPNCGSKNTHVASTPDEIRKLRCKACKHTWKLTR